MEGCLSAGTQGQLLGLVPGGLENQWMPDQSGVLKDGCCRLDGAELRTLYSGEKCAKLEPGSWRSVEAVDEGG